jgi:superfamily II DNA or RNA helicase
MLQSPTGSGKSIVATSLIRGAYEKGKKAYFICDRIELIEQAAAHFDRADIPLGVCQADHDRTDRTHRVQVASIQTMAKRMCIPADLYIIDEVHVFHKAHIKLMADNPDAIFLGLSATPWAKGLGKHFSKLIVVSTTQKLIDNGFLVRPEEYGPSKPDLEKVGMLGGDYEENALEKASNTPKLVGDIVEHWLSLARGRQTFAYAVNIKHSMAIAEAFCRAGIVAAHLDCYSKPEEREDIMRDFRAGRIQVLSSVELLSRGVDCPSVSCIILARATKSLMLYVQMVGRGLRISPGKDDGCIVLDHSGNTERHGFVTDDMPTELDDGSKKESVAPKKEPRLPKPCPQCHYLKITPKCPKCGAESVTYAKDVAHVDGTLVSLRGKTKDSGNGKAYTTAEKELIYAQLLGYARDRGYKSGWAYHRAQQITGTYPARSKQVQPVEPTPEIVAKITHLNIKRRYQQEKEQSCLI